MTVDTFESRRPEASPKVTTVLRFATTTPRIPVPVDTFVIRNVKSDDSSAFRDDFRPTGMSDPPRTLADACKRGTLANACEPKRNDLASPPGLLDPNLKTGTLPLRIREKKIRKINSDGGVSQVAARWLSKTSRQIIVVSTALAMNVRLQTALLAQCSSGPACAETRGLGRAQASSFGATRGSVGPGEFVPVWVLTLFAAALKVWKLCKLSGNCGGGLAHAGTNRRRKQPSRIVRTSLSELVCTSPCTVIIEWIRPGGTWPARRAA